VQTAGCVALGTLALTDDNKMKAIHAGAIEAILQALRAHADEARVQEYGCRALGNISEGHIAAISARSSRLVCDGMKAAVAALNAHYADANVMRHACGVLHHLMTGPGALRVEAGKIGAVTAVAAALRAHPADAFVQQHGCNALACLCVETSANVVQACGAGALQAVVAALRAHAANLKVQNHACDALACLVKAHPRLQAAAGAAGAVEAAVDATRTPAADTQLLRMGCTVLRDLVRGHVGNAARACAAGFMDVLAVAMAAPNAHEDTATDFSVYDTAVRTLDVLLAGDNGDAAQSGVHAGVLDILVREGTQRSHSSVLAEHARVVALLQAAAQRHDAAVCTHNGCKRCATARDAGRMCALPGCGARKRDGDGGKKLLRCGSCRAACYCAPAHQRADWGRHKEECAARGQHAAAGGGVM
jgi:hypothetical protein